MSHEVEPPVTSSPRVAGQERVPGSLAAEPCTTSLPWSRYIALGDSFTEGLWDPYPYDDGTPAPAGTASSATQRGWADRLADALSTRRIAAGGEALEYANLAIRGRLLDQVLEEQLPTSLEAAPDLVSLVGGGNDLLRPHADLDGMIHRLDRAVRTVRATGADVLLASGFKGIGPMSVTRGRTGVYTSSIWSIARKHGAFVLDLWGLEAISSPQAWADDRLHLSPQGHRRVADAALVALGLELDRQDDDVPREQRAGTTACLDRARADAQWARAHVLPWVHRRIRGASTGDARAPKWPEPTRWHEPRP